MNHSEVINQFPVCRPTSKPVCRDISGSPEGALIFREEWCRFVEEPTREAGVATPQLVARYRYILSPIVDCVLDVERKCPNQQVLILELVQRRWYHHLLHNKRAAVLKGLLLLRGHQRITVINVPVVSRIVRPVLSEGLTVTLRSRARTAYNWPCLGLHGSASESGVE
jgi:hypothetical protein